MNGFTLYRVVDVHCGAMSGIREEPLWTGREIMDTLTGIGAAARGIVQVMISSPGMDRVEWDQDGEHYMLRRIYAL